MLIDSQQAFMRLCLGGAPAAPFSAMSRLKKLATKGRLRHSMRAHEQSAQGVRNISNLVWSGLKGVLVVISLAMDLVIVLPVVSLVDFVVHVIVKLVVVVLLQIVQ